MNGSSAARGRDGCRLPCWGYGAAGGGKRRCMWFSWFGYGTTTPLGPRSPVEKPTKTVCTPAATKRSRRSWARSRSIWRGGDRCAQVTVEPRVVHIHVEPVLMGDVLVHPAAVAQADVPDDHPRGVRMCGAVGADHGEDRPDRVLVAVEPVRQVRNAVRDRIPGDPVGPFDGKLRPVDEASRVREADRGRVVPVDLAELRRPRELVLWRLRGGGALMQERRFGDPEAREVEPEGQARRILLERAGVLPTADVPDHGDRQHRGRPEDERNRRHRPGREPASPRRLRRLPPLP